MNVLDAFEIYLGKFNEFVLNWFTRLAMVLAAVMTGMILIQVFFRYFLNHCRDHLPDNELSEICFIFCKSLLSAFLILIITKKVIEIKKVSV